MAEVVHSIGRNQYGQYGNNFVKTMLKLAENHNRLKVVNDQRGCPTWTRDLAAKIIELIHADQYGTYHIPIPVAARGTNLRKLFLKSRESTFRLPPARLRNSRNRRGVPTTGIQAYGTATKRI